MLNIGLASISASLSVCVDAPACAHMPIHVQLFMTLWAVAWQAPLSMGSPRQEYWSELPFPSPGSLPDSGDQAHVAHIGRWVLYH